MDTMLNQIDIRRPRREPGHPDRPPGPPLQGRRQAPPLRAQERRGRAAAARPAARRCESARSSHSSPTAAARRVDPLGDRADEGRGTAGGRTSSRARPPRPASPSNSRRSEAALGNPYATSTTPTVHVPPSSIGTTVVAIAERYLGIPYVYAGASPSGGFDCSGLVMYVFAQVGISLPHYAASQYGYGMPVSQDQLEAGDLVFFDGLGHVGIYIGGGNFIHAPHTGDVVKISSLSESWYTENYVGARRISRLGSSRAERRRRRRRRSGRRAWRSSPRPRCAERG